VFISAPKWTRDSHISSPDANRRRLTMMLWCRDEIGYQPYVWHRSSELRGDAVAPSMALRSLLLSRLR
jgi:hypothetical protein